MLPSFDTNGDRLLGELCGDTAQSKIEVWQREGEDGAALLEMVEYRWGSGLGWYVQKRMTLDNSQVEALRLLLGPAAKPAAPARTLSSVRREDNVIQLFFAS